MSKIVRVLLDTNVAAGVISSISEKSESWKRALSHLLSDIPEAEIIIPTPVCMELAQRDGEWYHLLVETAEEDLDEDFRKLFSYSKFSIGPQIYYAASKYRLITRGNQGQKQAYFIDSLIAAYALTYNFSLVTMNQKDYSKKLFSTKNLVVAPERKNKIERESIWLLEPNKQVWNAYKVRKSSYK